MFTIGSATLPEYGMGRIGDVLAEKIPTENMMFNARCVMESTVLGPKAVLNDLILHGTEYVDVTNKLMRCGVWFLS
jgi:hypothetical protein